MNDSQRLEEIARKLRQIEWLNAEVALGRLIITGDCYDPMIYIEEHEGVSRLLVHHNGTVLSDLGPMPLFELEPAVFASVRRFLSPPEVDGE